jgi:hypothetical protein
VRLLLRHPPWPLRARLLVAEAEVEPGRPGRRPIAGLGSSALSLVAATPWFTSKWGSLSVRLCPTRYARHAGLAILGLTASPNGLDKPLPLSGIVNSVRKGLAMAQRGVTVRWLGERPPGGR